MIKVLIVAVTLPSIAGLLTSPDVVAAAIGTFNTILIMRNSRYVRNSVEPKLDHVAKVVDRRKLQHPDGADARREDTDECQSH